jgi:hypothetical protein
MKSREEELAGKVRAYLDQATTDLRPGLAYRLQQARAQAVGLAEPRLAGTGRMVGAHGLLGAGAGGGSMPAQGGSRPLLSTGRLWLGVGIVALAVLGWQQWVAWQELSDIEDIDAQILTSDLPIDAFVDRGFHLFLEVAPTLPPPMPAPPDVAPTDEAPPGDAPAGEASAEPQGADAGETKPAQ